MATEVIKVVDPDMGSGYNYDSLFDWEAAQQGDLTGVRDEIAVAKCRCTGGTADTTAVTINGWTTSATQYIKIWTDPSESYRHNGTYQTGNKYRVEGNSGGWNGVVYSEESFIKVIGLAVTLTYADVGQTAAIKVAATSGTQTIAYNICTQEVGYQSGTGIITSGGTSYIYNNILYNFNRFESGSTSSGGIGAVKYAAGTAYVYNNTCVNCDSGLVSNDVGDIIAINNLCNGCGSAGVGTFAAGTDYNATDDAVFGYTVTDSGNTHDHTSHTFTFVGASDFHLASNDAGAIGLGLNLYNDAICPFQDDIDGQDRGGAAAAWDIGADEYVASAGASIVPILLKHYQVRRD
jgi:hypothetical protein